MASRDDAGGAGDAVPVLGSGRLVLRPLSPADAPAVAALADDFEVARWMSRIPHPYRLEDADLFLREIAPRELCWAVAPLGEGLAGIVGFAPCWHPSEMELGYWIGRPFWGRGLATEAAALALGHAWARGATGVRSGHYEGNDRSARVLAKLGFLPVSRSKRRCLARGCDLPHVDLAMERPAHA